jgi:hypothetical protein
MMSKKSRDTFATTAIIGSLIPEMGASPRAISAMAEKLRVPCCQSRKFGSDTLFRVPFSLS